MKNLNRIVEGLKDASAFLDWYKKQWIHGPCGRSINPKIEKSHWDLACYYSGFRPQGLYKYCETILNVISENGSGMSTFNSAYAVWTALKAENKTIQHVGANYVSSKLWIENVKIFAPKHFVKFMDSNRIEFKNGSKIISKIDTVSLRGTFADLVFLEDVDRYNDLKDVWFASVPQVGEKGKVILSSNSSFVCRDSASLKNDTFYKKLYEKFGGFIFKAKVID